MTTAPPAGPPAAPPAAPLALVETDSFCDCGYNLHGQVVWRDANLDLLVCRCPECGRHSAAGRFTGIHSAWLHRLSMGMILAWVLFLLALFAFLIPMCALWPAIDMDRFVTTVPAPGQGPNPTQYMWDLRNERWLHSRGAQYETAIAIFFAAVNGWVLGASVSVFLWHLRKRAYLLVMMPPAVAVLVYLGWTAGGWELTQRLWEWVVARVVMYGALETALVVAGIWTGRPVARFVLRLLLPERLLQHLAFLWYRDGKTPPFQKSGVAA